MTHPDAQRAFEEMMPEPDIRIDAFGEITPTDRRLFVMGDFYTADQMRTAMQAVWDAATERAAKVCEAERIDEIHEGDLIYNEAVDKCATAIRSSGRGDERETHFLGSLGRTSVRPCAY